MSKYEKFLQKAVDAPGNFRFSDLCSLADLAGFVFDRSAGSHRIYKHPSGVMMNFQDVNGKAKPYQVKQLLDFIRQRKGE